MTNLKSTKRALLASTLALILCFSMLLGTTYAWFTDSVTSGNNIITSGNLDVELWHTPNHKANPNIGFGYNEETGTEIKGDTPLFLNVNDQPILWEPGASAGETFRVTNAGSLALKYQFKIKTTETTKTPAGKTLAEKLDLQIVQLENNENGIPVAVTGGVYYEAKFGEGYIISGELQPGESHDYNVAIDWVPSVDDNEYNVAGGLQIKFAVDLLATQLASEIDGMGDNKYDEDAWMEGMIVKNQNDLAAAFDKGGEIELGQNVTLDKTLSIPAGKNVTLDLNGNTLTGSIIAPDAELTVENGIITNTNPEASAIEINSGKLTLNNVDIVSNRHALRVDGNSNVEVIINGGTYRTEESSGKTQHALNVSGTASVIINGGTFVGPAGTASDSGAAVNVQAGASVTINGGNFSGGKNKTLSAAGALIVNGGTFDQDPSAYVADGFKAIKNGDLYYVVSTNVDKLIVTAEDLVAAFADLEANDVLYIAADLDMTGKTVAPVTGNKGFTMYGNGYTISNLNTTAAALFVAHSGSSSYTFDNVVLENCSVNSATNYGALFVGDGDTSDAITITNCVVKNCNVTSAKYAAAFVAYTAGYNVQNNGPVYSDVLIENCSVIGGSITGGGSVGAAIGHAGGNVDTTNTITNVKVDGVAINGEDTEHTGAIVGTAHVGETIITNSTYENVTGNSNGLYGRFVPGSTGMLVINGKQYLSNSEDLANSLANAAEGSEIILAGGVNYGTVTIEELKNVTITAAAGTTMIFKTDANTKIENVTIDAAGFKYDGATADCGIVIDANAQIENLVLEGCTFTGTGAKAGRGLSGFNNNATIVLRNCTFENMGYPIYAWGGYESLVIDNCTFKNIKSWAIMPQSGFDGDLTVTNCKFIDCLGGGLIKAGTLTAGHTFTFTNNTITGCTVAGDHNWFQFDTSAGTAVIAGNTMDGADWTPGEADGLK